MKDGVWSQACSESEAGLGREREPLGGSGHRMERTHINGAAQQGASLQRLEDDAVEVAGCLPQLVPFSDPTCEVLKALGGAAS